MDASLGTPLAVLLVIFFVVPGLILKKTIQALAQYAPSNRRYEIIECLVSSCLNYIVGIIPVYILIKNWPQGDGGLDLQKYETIPYHAGYLILWSTVVFVLPVFIGIFLGVLLRQRCIRNILGRLGISILHPAPTAWDYVFARNQRYWARVSLTNNELIEGVFDSNSLASEKKEERDLFLEAVYEFDETTGEYTPISQNSGIWISGNQIKTISFFEIEPDKNPKMQINISQSSDENI